MVPAPSFLILASHEVRMLSSRSVAVMVNWLPLASTSRFDKMGIVVLRSTTPCVVESSFNSADFVTLNSIALYSSRAVPGPVIVKLPSTRAVLTPSVASILPLRYCTRFLVKYKVRRVPQHCGNRWETQLLLLHLPLKSKRNNP